MAIFLLIVGVLLLSLTAALLVRAMALPRMRMSMQLRQIGTYGFNASAVNPSEPTDRISLVSRLSSLAERIGRRTAGSGWRAPVEARSLRAAGVYTITADAFHGYRVMASLLLPGFLFLIALSGSFSAMNVLLIVACAALCWLAPAVLVRTRAQRRMDDVDRMLPELIDVLTATIEAGLGFAGSLQLVAERFGGPLGQELRLTLQEQNMGLSTRRGAGEPARAMRHAVGACVRAGCRTG